VRVLGLAAIAILFMCGCQTPAQKNMSLLEDRVTKLRPLSKWTPRWCRVEARLTEPARARYEALFSSESVPEVLSYTWKAYESRCEVTRLDSSQVSQNYKSFLETGLCLLLQTHYVNSPFDELMVLPKDLSVVEGRVQLRTSPDDGDVGLFLTPGKEFLIETKTRQRGRLMARYEAKGSARDEAGPRETAWLPVLLEHHSLGLVFVVDQITYDGRMIKSLRVSVGEEGKVIPHSDVLFEGCQKI